VLVFLTGASGFIGSHLAAALQASGHQVLLAARAAKATAPMSVAVDYTRDFDPAVWHARLTGVDVVVNAVGILRERGAQTFDALHVRAPRALFAACVDAGVRRVIQISALGADEAATSEYHATKFRADSFLSTLPVSAAIVQPSLVYGAGGSSARLFDTLASLPLIPLPGAGDQRIQPIHIDDLVDAIVALIGTDHWRVGRIALVGPEALTLRDYLARLRSAMGLGRARFVPIPRPVVRAATRVGAVVPGALLDRESLAMLERGNVADAVTTGQLLGRSPRPAERFIETRGAQPAAREARLNWLLPLLAWSIAAMWIVTGIVSLAVYPHADSYALLARTGITGTWAPLALGAAAATNLALGVASVIARSRALWWTQIALIVVYTAIISWRLPEFWAHPFGPLLKNVPILAALLLLAALEEK
jgi:uncharacterized protein YbjT (DUF2867 family)